MRADDVCLDGHFPGRPIVPGAMLLAVAAKVLAEDGFAIVAVRRLKFRRALGPDEPFEIDVTLVGDGARITWSTAGATLAEARVTLAAGHG